MSQAPSAQPERNPGAPTIADDTPCRSCGYNLRGLVIGTRCPECGTVIVGKGKARLPQDTMADAPKAYLNLLSVGFACVGVAASIYLLTTFALVMDFAAAVRSNITGITTVSGMPSSLLTRFGGLVASVLWVTGAAIVILPRPGVDGKTRGENGRPEWYRLRLGVLITAGALGLTSGAYSLSLIFGISGLAWIGWLIGVTFFASVIPLCVHLSNLAYWGTDTDLSDRLRSIGILLGITGLLLAVLFSPVGIIIGLFAGMIILGCIVLLIWFIVLMFKMSSMVSWAVQNAKQAEARDQRFAEKARREAEEMPGVKTPAIPANVPDDPATRRMLEDLDRRNREAEAESPTQYGSPPAPPQTGPGMHSTDADPYALEDD